MDVCAKKEAKEAATAIAHGIENQMVLIAAQAATIGSASHQFLAESISSSDFQLKTNVLLF